MPKSPNHSAINLSERIEQLSSKRQEIIRPILEHPKEYVLLSIRALATRLKTDPRPSCASFKVWVSKITNSFSIIYMNYLWHSLLRSIRCSRANKADAPDSLPLMPCFATLRIFKA